MVRPRTRIWEIWAAKRVVRACDYELLFIEIILTEFQSVDL
jgi:hypothetical protein